MAPSARRPSIRHRLSDEKLFHVRNAEMTRKIEAYLKTRETHFVVVGAGHLVGERGIVQTLRRKGYTVEQL